MGSKEISKEAEGAQLGADSSHLDDARGEAFSRPKQEHQKSHQAKERPHSFSESIAVTTKSNDGKASVQFKDGLRVETENGNWTVIRLQNPDKSERGKVLAHGEGSVHLGDSELSIEDREGNRQATIKLQHSGKLKLELTPGFHKSHS